MRNIKSPTESSLASLLIDKLGSERNSIIETYVSQTDLSREEFWNELSFLKGEQDGDKFIEKWLMKADAIRTLEDLEFVFSVIDSDYRKIVLAKTWLNQGERALEEFKSILPFFKEDWIRGDLAKAWLNKDKRSLEDFQFALPLFEDAKDDRAKAWLSSSKRTLEDFQLALSFFNEDWEREEFLETWLNQDRKTSEDFQFALSILETDSEKIALARAWLNKDNRVLADLQCALSFILPRNEKIALTIEWLDKSANPEIKYSDFITLVKSESFCTLYDIRSVIYIQSAVNLPANKIGDLCKDLYPLNENLWAETFKEFLRRNPQIANESKQDLASFIKDFNNDEYALQSLEALKQKIQLSPLEILEITQVRLSNKYRSLEEILKSKKANDSLSENGEVAVNNEFQQRLSDEITLAGLFSYYEINGQKGLAIFKSIIKEDVLEELRANFIPSTAKAYILDSEFEKLQSILDDQEKSELNLDLPKVKILSDYLSLKVGDTNLPPEQIATYQFGKSDTLDRFLNKWVSEDGVESKESESERVDKNFSLESLTQEFVAMLSCESVNQDNVANFFEKTLELEGKINDRDRKVLGEFFGRDKFLLASLLQQNGGFDKFAGNIGALKDGCFANIGTGVRVSVYASLVQDISDQILFSVFSDKFSAPILNSGGGVDHPVEGSDAKTIFSTSRINNSYISTPALVEEVKREFFDGDKIVRSSTDFFRSQLGDEKAIEVIENIFADHQENANSKFAEVATYLVLKNSLPEILESKYLANFKNAVEEILNSKTINLEDIEISEEVLEDPYSSPRANEYLHLRPAEKGRDNS